MSNYHSDPRRHTRVPMTGDVQWRSGLGAGVGEILDMSECGAAVKVPVREAFQVGPSVTLNMELGKGLGWFLTDEATVVQKMPENDGTCRIGVEFSARLPKGAPGIDSRRDGISIPPTQRRAQSEAYSKPTPANGSREYSLIRFANGWIPSISACPITQRQSEPPGCPGDTCRR